VQVLCRCCAGRQLRLWPGRADTRLMALAESDGELGTRCFTIAGRKRVLFVCSSGGHLSQLLQLRPWWEQHERRWVTFDLPDARSKLVDEDLVSVYHPTTRSLTNLARNIPLARGVLRQFQPDVVISNGAGVALPFFVLARMTGIPTVYLEVYDRIDSRTLTGRLCRPFTSRFLVQWPEQELLYPGSTLIGPLY
jgi:UDP-N-acetylglucosamine:LPS N-acetylglucosamine transferase